MLFRWRTAERLLHYYDSSNLITPLSQNSAKVEMLNKNETSIMQYRRNWICIEWKRWYRYHTYTQTIKEHAKAEITAALSAETKTPQPFCKKTTLFDVAVAPVVKWHSIHECQAASRFPLLSTMDLRDANFLSQRWIREKETAVREEKKQRVGSDRGKSATQVWNNRRVVSAAERFRKT